MTLEVKGLVRSPLTLTVDELRSRFTPVSVDTTYANDDRRVSATYTGARLWDVLQAAGVTAPFRVEGRADDDFRCLLKWEEIDGNRSILVAYAVDGQPLPEKSGTFRLVVPGDKQGVRHLRRLATLTVLDIRNADI